MRMKREQQLETIRSFLRTQSTLVLSTCSAEGEPYATPLFYFAGDDLSLYWVSSARSRHSIDAERQSRVSLAVFHPTQQWRAIAGVQMMGLVDWVSGAERKRVLESYCLRFQLGLVLSAAARRSRLYRFRPRWIRYINNARRLGYRFELELGGS